MTVDPARPRAHARLVQADTGVELPDAWLAAVWPAVFAVLGADEIVGHLLDLVHLEHRVVRLAEPAADADPEQLVTVTASVGQSASQGMQYQHSSYFIWALPVSSLIQSTSSGQTSMQTRQPLSAMHLFSSMTTGTLDGWVAMGMVILLDNLFSWFLSHVVWSFGVLCERRLPIRPQRRDFPVPALLP